MKKRSIKKTTGRIIEAIVKPDKIKEAVETAVETIAKPVTVPVTFLTDKFNALMKVLEEKTTKKEVVSEVDGFVDTLIEEARDAEKGLFAFFGELLFLHNLNESMASLENELTLIEILGQRTYQFLKPDFVVAYFKPPEGSLVPAYRYPQEAEVPWSALGKMAGEDFHRGEALLYENKRLEGRVFSLASVPLRTTSERFGVLMVGRRDGRGNFRSDEVSLVIAGATLISFLLSNIKLHQKILRDRRLVTIGETISGLSHDIKNILNNLEGGLGLLETGIQEKDFEAMKTGQGILRRAYDRMKDLVLAMVDYSKERPPDLKPVDLNALVDKVLLANKDGSAAKEIKVKKEFDKNLPQMYLDSSRIDRMLTNLLHNALDAVAAGKGRITVGTRFHPKDKIVSLWVKDNGHGIPPATLNRIFDVFYSTKGSRGTGFGLAIVQKVVQEHSGSIEVNSEVGRGTTFLIRLPIRASG